MSDRTSPSIPQSPLHRAVYLPPEGIDPDDARKLNDYIAAKGKKLNDYIEANRAVIQ